MNKMDREVQIQSAAQDFVKLFFQELGTNVNEYPTDAKITMAEFTNGAKWADKNPLIRWHKVDDGVLPKENPEKPFWSFPCVIFMNHAVAIGYYDFKHKDWFTSCHYVDIDYWYQFPLPPYDEQIEQTKEN